MQEVFGEHGYISRLIPSFEFRKEQVQMAEFILERLYDSGNAIIEAGTGTGKTLAYLVPAVMYALEQDKKIAISTETKALQKQLVDKDLPIVRELAKTFLDSDITYSLCLGSSNYPCRKRFETALLSGKFNAKELKKLEKVQKLFAGKKIFTYFDLGLPGHVWSEINREGETCNSYKCVFAPVCSYQMARKEWSQSTILVMNHYLFFTNIASGKTYLPQCEVVVFDEAHALEEIAASQMGFNLGYRELLEILALFKNDKKHHIIASIGDDRLRSVCSESIKKITSEVTRFFETIRDRVRADRGYVRIPEPVPEGNTLVALLKDFLVHLAEAEKMFDEEHPLRIEFDLARGQLFSYIESLSSFVFQNSENHVYWIERESDAILGDLFLRGQPVDIAELFNREVITSYDSSIFVSATLAVNEDFSYIVGRLGIENHKSLPLKSSFDYPSQTVLYIARDMADPANDAYNIQAASDAAEIINFLNGNCLMLFTSYKTLREVRTALSRLIDFPIYSQDLLAPTDAFDRYVNDVNSVLMGTHSFWQGIDLPGDLVRGVLVMKLPFAVPDSPPMEAKMERIVQAGKNPFTAVQMPEAVIRFKQGFGRLIRSSTDRGIVAVLDSRVFSKSYGKMFLKSIPECRVVYSLDELKKAYATMVAPIR
jgi:ATP-dependent DNA helicase DinG